MAAPSLGVRFRGDHLPIVEPIQPSLVGHGTGAVAQVVVADRDRLAEGNAEEGGFPGVTILRLLVKGGLQGVTVNCVVAVEPATVTSRT